jgi:hypothetical protein
MPGRVKIIFSIPQRRDRLWGPPDLLSSRYRGSHVKDAIPISRDVNLTVFQIAELLTIFRKYRASLHVGS